MTKITRYYKRDKVAYTLDVVLTAIQYFVWISLAYISTLYFKGYEPLNAIIGLLILMNMKVQRFGDRWDYTEVEE